MMSLRLLARNATPRLATSRQRLHTSKILLDSESSSSDSSDDEKGKRKPPQAEKDQTEKERSVHRLNSLLSSMIQQSKTPSKVAVAVSPKKPKRAVPQVRSSRSVTEEVFEKKLTAAAKDVAASLDGDTKKIESELLKKILDQKTTAREPVELGKLVKGMSIDRKESETIGAVSYRADQVRNAMKRHGEPYRMQMNKPRTGGRYQTRNADMSVLDSGTPMNIFNVDTRASPDPKTTILPTWNILEEQELETLFVHPPRNFVEQMIQWTEQGRLWRFPIDNEQGLTIDQEEHFSEHIFLEQYLEGWCPKKGPVSHFMELVCVGLSKNPYLSAKEKKDHIIWFKEYFAKQYDLLKELGAYGTGEKSAGEKQIEA